MLDLIFDLLRNNGHHKSFTFIQHHNLHQIRFLLAENLRLRAGAQSTDITSPFPVARVGFSRMGAFCSEDLLRSEERRLGEGGAYSLVACLSRSTADHASLSKRIRLPTPDTDRAVRGVLET